jgi:hypothetical protein
MKKLGVDEIEGRVVAIPRVDSKLDDNEIRLGEAEDKADNGVYEVIEGVDVEAAFGNEVTLFVKKDKVLGLTIESDFFIDALEKITDKKLNLVLEDEDYDFAEDVVVWIDGSEKDVDALADAYDYAKVVLDDDDDVVFVDAYMWDGFVAVEEVDDDVVFGYGEELDVEDYAIVKAGKVITVEDLEEGDMLFFSEKGEFAEVYNVSFTGPIEKVYDDAFEVDDEDFEYKYAVSGFDTQYLDGDELDDFDDEVAEGMMDEGEDVTVFVDRSGYAAFVTGETGEAKTSSFYGYIVFAKEEKDRRGDDYYELDVVNEAGKVVSYDVHLDDIDLEVDGEEIDEDDAPGAWEEVFGFGELEAEAEGIAIAIGDAGVVAKFEVDEDGEIDTLNLLTDGTYVTGDPAFETDDTYVSGLRLSDSAVVFNVEDYLDEEVENPDEDDIEVDLLGDLKYDKINVADIYVSSSNKVIVVVAYDTSRSENFDTFFAVATANARKVTGEDTWRLTLNINGVEDTYYTEEDAGIPKAKDVEKGDFLEVDIDKDTNEVVRVDRFTSGPRYKKGVVESRNVSDNKLKLVDDNVTYRLSDAVCLDDGYDVIRLREIAVDDEVELFLVADGSVYVAFVVQTGEESDGDDDEPGDIVFTYDNTNNKMTVAGLTYKAGEAEYFVKVSGDAIENAIYSDIDALAGSGDDTIVVTLEANIPVSGIYKVELIKADDFDVVAAQDKYLQKTTTP